MAQKLPKFTLDYNKKNENWELTNDKTDKVVQKFDTKQEATTRGTLREAIGGEGSVKIKKMDNKFQEERTFPKSKDPKSSKG